MATGKKKNNTPKKKAVIKKKATPKAAQKSDGQTFQKKKEIALLLFLRNDITQKEIADKVGVSEKTICQWAQQGEWEIMRKSLLVSKAEQMRVMLNIIEKITNTVNDDPKGGTPADADKIVKWANAYKALETETNLGQYFETLMQFISFANDNAPDLAKELTKLGDAFLKHIANKKR